MAFFGDTFQFFSFRIHKLEYLLIELENMHSKLLHMGSKLASRSTGQDLWKHEWTRGWGKLFTSDKDREECMGGEPKGQPIQLQTIENEQGGKLKKAQSS